MKSILLLALGLSTGTVHAACEDMYLWARMLQPGLCTPRTEYERREIARDKQYQQEAEVNDNRRRVAARELTRAMLAKVYGVSTSAVTVTPQNMYSINYGQYVCQKNEFESFGCLDTGGNPTKGLSSEQLKYIDDHSWNASIDDNGRLIPVGPSKVHRKKRK